MTIEVTAKKVDDAINQGLTQLGASLDEVNVEVLDAGGFLRKAKVRLTLERPAEKSEPKAQAEKQEKPEKSDKPVKPQGEQQKSSVAPSVEQKPADKEKTEKKQDAPKKAQKPAAAPVQKPEKAAPPEKTGSEKSEKTEKAVESKPRKRTEEDKAAAARALEFIKEIVHKMGFEGVEYKTDESGEHIEMTAQGGDDSLIIGRHGETLSALSYIAETCARAEKCHVNIVVDCNGYRERRAASLSAMARRRANECVEKRRKIKLEPMDRIDRRTVHNALNDDTRVSTASEGKEPHRYVVIIPNRNQ